MTSFEAWCKKRVNTVHGELPPAFVFLPLPPHHSTMDNVDAEIVNAVEVHPQVVIRVCTRC